MTAVAADIVRHCIDIRRRLHGAPELSGQEWRTRDLVIEELKAAGLSPRTFPGSAGVTVLCPGRPASDGPPGRPAPDGTPRRCVALRADMDALPLEETPGLPWASRHAGAMHACGHDGHTGILLGVARHLAANPAPVDALLVFQPAEESGNGARRLLDDGCFDGHPVAAVFGLHGWPDLPLGQVGVHAGAVMASVDNFEIAVRGRGGHGGQPQHARDPVQAACQLVVAMQSLVSRGVDPLEGAVLTVGQIQGGHTYNVIPESCLLKGTLRAHSEALRRDLQARLDALCRGLVGGLGLETELAWLDGCPATVNHPDMAALARRAVDRAFGPGRRVEPRPTMAAEDFSFFLERAPGAYLWLGLGDARGPLHNPRFDFNDQALESGIRLFLGILDEFA